MANNTYSLFLPDILHNEVYDSVPKLLYSGFLKSRVGLNKPEIEPKLRGSLRHLNNIVEKLGPHLKNDAAIEISRDKDAVFLLRRPIIIKTFSNR